MASEAETVDEFSELATLVKASFPSLACLRCGNEDFYLETELANWDQSSTMAKVLSRNGRPPFISLICTRCGHVEQHARYVLERAAKPIPASGEGGR
jgi:predicted nucleic-acid-binding Zn-ribbon protein